MKVDQVESVSVMDEALLSNESVPPKESHLFPLRISNSLSLELPPKDSDISLLIFNSGVIQLENINIIQF
ncbi:putative mitochondrial transferase [Tieghemostelium lacteum]|uniref:Putative mitochondrial transferase n=1 Tax=Tieghemostelium lacteum TaxID=361077 RepID=A0A151ZJM3_TIELA|nr:putative mitochondrial transferase [Tieghemostelium lacteum]|eukprot:KYQ94201.1 putative mitochondrial transferase [Tieghemostelium lacteum]